MMKALKEFVKKYDTIFKKMPNTKIQILIQCALLSIERF